MPDTRSHRGPHPEDAKLFAPSQWPALRAASRDLWWLLDRGYALPSALTLVGNRHALSQRQRLAVTRCACSAGQRAARRARETPITALTGATVCLDGYNLLISLESALSGAVILAGRDGCYRDLASLHGTYRSVSETEPAMLRIGETLATLGVAHCHWLLDRPVSNSGRLKTRLGEIARSAGWSWQIDLEFNPDKLLSESGAVVATSDSAVLDRCARWVNLARAVITACVPDAFVLDWGETAGS